MAPGVILLLIVALVWGSTFPLLKSVSGDLNGLEISTLRFVLAAFCMLPFLSGISRGAWRDGAVLGGLALASYVAQAYGLQHISSNRSAFLTSLNVLMVPFLGLLLGSRMSLFAVFAALLACCGIALMSWENGGNLRGDGATLVCALAYALYVIVLSRCAYRHDAKQLAAAQIAVMAVAGMVAMLLQSFHADGLATLAVRAQPHAAVLLYLGICATAGMLVLQAVAQRNVPAEKAAVVYAMEPVFAALFAWLWLNEMLGWRGVAGGALVLAAIVMSELRTAAAGEIKAR